VWGVGGGGGRRGREPPLHCGGNNVGIVIN